MPFFTHQQKNQQIHKLLLVCHFADTSVERKVFSQSNQVIYFAENSKLFYHYIFVQKKKGKYLQAQHKWIEYCFDLVKLCTVSRQTSTSYGKEQYEASQVGPVVSNTSFLEAQKFFAK